MNDLYTVINRQNGNLAFKLFSFTDNSHFDHLQRNNFYSIIWIQKGEGLLKVDFSEYLFQENNLFTFSPFQPFMFSANQALSGMAIQFHSDFYCIHRNPNETNCDTVLFNNIYEAPFFTIDTNSKLVFENCIEQLKVEFLNSADYHYELLVPILKILLVTASRLKEKSLPSGPQFTNTKTPFVLRNFRKVLEENFREKHSAGEYAEILNISSNALAKLVKAHFNKTLTEIITERIIIEAKRELYMTSKAVKEIAMNLGYSDEFYFSRVFKANTEISPQLYRDTVGFGKAEQN